MAQLDTAVVERLNRERRDDAPVTPLNGVTTPSPERLKEAVREANDPRRLVAEPQFAGRR